MLICQTCKLPHDLDLAPDVGECTYCNGTLVENLEEKRTALHEYVHEMWTNAILKMNLSRKKIGSGEN